MKESKEPMKIIRETMENVPGDHRYYFPYNSTPFNASLDKSNLVKALISKLKI